MSIWSQPPDAPANPPRAPTPSEAAPPSLVSLEIHAFGIDLLDALVVFQPSDAAIYGLWARRDVGFRAEDVVPSLRDTYRHCQFASRRLGPTSSPRSDLTSPVITLELPARTVILRGVRGYLLACLFDPSMPLGMARFVSARIARRIDPELPRIELANDRTLPPPATPSRPVVPASALRDARTATVSSDFDSRMTPPIRRSRPPAPPGGHERIRKLLAYLEGHAPEPHVVRTRLALRAGLTLTAIDHPEDLGPEATVLIETAIQDILGIDRAELKRIG